MYSSLEQYTTFLPVHKENYKDIPIPSVTFLTFGNDRFKKSLQRIQEEARKLPFDNIIGYNETHLKNISEFWDRNSTFVESNQRGYGYWLWKAFLTWHTLRSMKEGDVLVYADAGCTIHPHVEEFKEDIHKVRNSKSGVISWALGHVEKTWSKMDLIDHLNAQQFIHDHQLHATFFMLRCSKETVALTKRWYEIGCNHKMIDDSPSKLRNDPTFREHRHDQSIFSLLRKIHGSDIYRKNRYIDDTRITN